MTFLIKLLQIILYLAILVAGYCFWFNQTLSINSSLTQFLDSSKGYEVGALVLQDQINKSLTPTQANDPTISQSLKKNITSAQVKKLLQPTQISLLDWLHSSQSTTDLHLQLDLESIKDHVLADIADPQAGFQLKKTLPDVIQLSPTDPSFNQFFTTVSTLRDIEAWAVRLLGWSLLVIGGDIAVLIILRLRKGSKIVTTWAWPVLLASITMLVAAVVFYFLDQFSASPQLALSNLNIAMPYYLSRALSQTSFLPVMVMATLSGVAIVMSKLVFRAKDKKLKDKRKK